MQSREPLERTNALLCLGMLFLVFANLARFFLPRVAVLSEDLADGLTGFFFGVAISLLLWSVVRRSRQSSCRM